MHSYSYFLHASIYNPALCLAPGFGSIEHPFPCSFLRPELVLRLGSILRHSEPSPFLLLSPWHGSNTSVMHLHPRGICILRHRAAAAAAAAHVWVSSDKGCNQFSWAVHHAGEHWSRRCWNSVAYWDTLNGVVHNGPFGHTIENCHVEMLHWVREGNGMVPAVLLQKINFPLKYADKLE